MKALLERNNIWNEKTKNYLSNVVSICTDFKASSTPPPNRRVLLVSLNRDFNDVICMDHMFLGIVTVFHMMDVGTQVSVGTVVNSTSMDNVIYRMGNI